MSLSEKVAMTYQKYPLDYHYGAAGWIPANASLCIPDLAFNDAGQGVGDGQQGRPPSRLRSHSHRAGIHSCSSTSAQP
jgi:hypothetical protein